MLARRSRVVLAQASIAVGASAAFFACGETVTQIDPSDVVEIRLSADSARIAVDRTLDLDAFTLDADRGLVIGPIVAWSSSNAAVVTVDEDGLLTGQSIGTAEVVASYESLRDTTFVTVVAPPMLVVESDSVWFAKAAGAAEPVPDTVDVSNGGGLDLLVTVDSIVYGSGATGWLSAQLTGSVAPTELALSTATGGITTAGRYEAAVWLSGLEADGSPAAIVVTLAVNAAAPFSMTLEAGDGQSATAGSAVNLAPSVRVRDEFGNAAQGASVTFTVTGGGGSVAGSPAPVDASGIARVTSWTLGTVAGANQLTATIGALPPVVFSATGKVGAATQVVVIDGNNQSALSGAAVGVAPSVSVRDQYGNGVGGVTVTFAVTSGGGSITGGSQTSGAGGVATLGSWTLGTTAGPNTLSATAAGVATPVVFTATGLTGDADSIFLVDGDAQTDSVAATLPTAYKVRVVDVNGNGVEGIPVAWSAIGGGSITDNSLTDADGYATAVRVLGTAPGADSATANVGGLAGSPVEFGATVTVGTPDQIRIAAGGVQTDTVGEPVAVVPKVIVEDLFDNPIEGHSVTFEVTAGGGTVDPITAVATGADGTATVSSWTLGIVAGTSNTLRATAAGPGIAGQFVTFTATSVADAPTQFLIVAGNNQTAVTGTAVATAPTVAVRDKHGNGVSGRTIDFSSSNGGVGSASVVTDANGEASTSWTVFLTSGTLQADGTFPDTLSAATTGFITQRILASAVYSFATHVDPIFAASCNGCHGSGGGAGGMNFDGTAAQDYTTIVNVVPNCDGTLAGAGYRRVSAAGGATGESLSIVIRKLDNTIAGVGTCGNHGGGEVAPGTSFLEILRAWIRNGAPNN